MAQTAVMTTPRQVRTQPLERLLAPVAPREFLASTWGRGHLLLRRGDGEAYRGLFSLEDFDRCLATAKRHAGVIMSVVGAAGSERPPLEGPVTDELQEQAYKRFARGDTIRIVGVERVWPAVSELCLSLGEAFNARTHANAYLTPAGAQGFSVHFDYHDVFILQVSGAKEWFVYEPEHALPVDLDFAHIWASSPRDEAALVLRERAVLACGDLLYMPRGYYHKALTSSSHSLHLTVSIDPLYWVTVLKKAVELTCLEHPELREALAPGALADPELAGASEARFHTLLELLRDRASFAATSRALIADRFDAVAQPGDGHFADLVQLGSLRQESLVARRSGLPVLVEARGTQAVIQFGGNRVEGPLGLLPALDFIQGHGSFEVRELPEAMTAPSKLVLVRRLVEDGLLRIESI